MTLKSDRILDEIRKNEEILRMKKEYPDQKLADIIKEVGFECELCAKCCTSSFNDHVFLLEEDRKTIEDIDPEALVPAPGFELCDQKGRFYTCGYILQTKPDTSCVFLEDGYCQIYSQRPLICRVYPYMLHMEADETGRMDWRQISGLNEHGYYHTEIDSIECMKIAQDTKKYEIEFQQHMIDFLKTVRKYFRDNQLRHVPAMYDRMMRAYQKGEDIEVMVFCNSSFKKHVIKI
ncbi:protein of unknown function UPF0153 [Methanosalsum zhilinae DSM 4017]|uniref:Fe-S oxidoreductase n=1 Tax=Methanosalsum zhilinae (strain DSM 4017 / NBRC 107636 / OCM 62 / WeN5) TaxID=679901 RepID=F7XP80_METZD|nr:YkgJ family cysteine cluster protein [Methanosalsum zhilinae]AEH61375.1 protein of unknown function UPF0153 [Methanosalsum zhilinae DSM 4017]